MDCVFCGIVQKKIPANFLYEDKEVVAFKDIKPAAPIHYLVLPKEHIQSIMHLTGNHKEIISKLIFTAKALAERENLRGYKLVFNVGREGGQVIDHLHLHLLGGWSPVKEKSEIDAMPHLPLDK
jgi:histidine triad (HIT) family protein